MQGGTLFKVLDDVEPLSRDPLAPFRMSVIDRFKDMGTIAMGKSEAGLVRKNDRLYVMPNKCARRSSSLLIPIDLAWSMSDIILTLMPIMKDVIEEHMTCFWICAMEE